MNAVLAPTKIVLNTSHARDMLRKRYPSPEWSLMEEVAPATGGGTRYADAIAVNLWRSRGHAIYGFEIKVSRADWLREMKQPEKAEPLYRYCDHWFIIAPKGVVNDGELPPTWGLLELRESGLTAKVPAPRLEASPLTREFFASLMRRGHENINAIAEHMQRQAVSAARDQIDERVRTEVESRTRNHKDLERRVAEFNEKTGLEIGRYSDFPIETIKLAQKLRTLNIEYGNARTLGRLLDLVDSLESAASTVREAIADSGLVAENASQPITDISTHSLSST